jgi:antitoxin component YwqK of YwqJK toxin-antitoxin module
MTVAVLMVAIGGCRNANRQIEATYDATGKLRLLVYDSNGNGKPDTWSYMDGARIVRVEIDKDEDGVLDRWEYYDANQRLERVGTSRANDGNVDTWTYPAADGTTSRVELSTKRDGRVTRTEFYEGGVLASAQEDTDGNGTVDKWETYANGVVSSVAFDTEGTGHPTRRLAYGTNGQVIRVETVHDLPPSTSKR